LIKKKKKKKKLFTYDRYFNKVGRSSAVQYNRILDSCSELKVDVANVTHVKRGQVDGGVGYTECHHIVKKTCK
jgi:hypothetical protein